MSLFKRVQGDLVIESITSGDTITVHDAGGITIDGDLTVTGNTTSVESTNTTIVDNTIVLNSGESGSVVSEGSAGIDIDRGSGTNAGIRFNETGTKWEIHDGTSWADIATGGGGLGNIVEDVTPQLGADLDVNGFSITSATNGDVVLVADGSGLVKIDQDVSLAEQVGDEVALAGYNKLYAKTPGDGGTGLYVTTTTHPTPDELVSKSKAILFSIIF